MRIRVKICCIQNAEEAQLAIRYGADALGFVSAMPSGPGPITDEEAHLLVTSVPPPISAFLLTSRQSAAGIIEQQQRVRAGTVQIVDALLEGTYAEIRDALPGVRIVQVIHVQDENAIRESVQIAPDVDALLLDSGNTSLSVKTHRRGGRQADHSGGRTEREQYFRCYRDRPTVCGRYLQRRPLP